MAALIVLFVVSIAVGIVAQAWRGHTGTVWGLVTVLLGLVSFVFLEFTVGVRGMPQEVDQRDIVFVHVIMVNGPVAVIMGLAACFLPKRTKAAPPAKRFPCPNCRELVLAGAKVCPHCQRDLP